jgi:hypothetical protein
MPKEYRWNPARYRGGQIDSRPYYSLEQLLTSPLLNWLHLAPIQGCDLVSFGVLFAVCCADTTIVSNCWQECDNGSLT